MAGTRERSLEMTSTWAVAVICFVLVAISIFLEYVLHLVGTWFKKKRKRALYEALEKIKAELMLLGFFSLMLSILQTYIARICIPRSVGHSWHPCPRDEESDDSEYNDPCLAQGRVQLVSAYGLNQLHKFVFALAVSHVIYSIITLGLGTLKMRKWKTWEDETKTIEYQYYNDPERFRFARETSFGRRHMSFWSKSPVLLWIVCFFRQFFGSVAKVDYLTLRHGFMIAHLAPQSQESFDFQKYIQRSLEEDFKHVVEITPIIWMFAVLFLLPNTNGWYSYFWLPFIPLVVLLVVGTKLQMIITKMGLRIQARGDVIKGTPVVEPGDHLFWFNRPRLLLFLINFVLFQNAFQLAFFAWSWYSFGIPSCFHRRPEDIAIRISMGVIIQVLCSYVTLPQYALVTQMGSNMKPAIFNDRVATALKSWYHSAKKNNKGGRRSENTTPFSSRPATPLHGTSPLHLLHNYPHYAADDSLQASPRASNYDNEGWGMAEGSVTSTHNNDNESTRRGKKSAEQGIQDPTTSRTSPAAGQMHQISEHEVGISLRDFSFIERG